MSVTYAIACPETKKMLWIGQRDFIYTADKETMELLTKFLYEHIGKSLVFDRHDEMDDDYEEYAYPTQNVRNGDKMVNTGNEDKNYV